MRLVFVSGSPRSRSNSRKLLLRAMDHAVRRHPEHEVDLLDLRDEPIDPFRGFGEPYSDATHAAVERLERADAIFLASPVYNGSYSSAMKNLFEHTPVDSIEGRVAGFLLAAGGPRSFLQVRAHLEELMTYFKVHVVPEAVYGTRDELHAGVPHDIDERVGKLVDSVVFTVERLRAPVDQALFSAPR